MINTENQSFLILESAKDFHFVDLRLCRRRRQAGGDRELKMTGYGTYHSAELMEV